MRSGPGKKDRPPAYGGGEARLRVSKERRTGLGGVARRRRGWAGAPGGRCRRRRHSAAMERPGAAAGGLSRRPHGLGLLLLLLLPLLPLATLGQDRLDAPPPPAAPLSRWPGPVGVSWGLRAAAPGGLFPRGGRWRRSAPEEDEEEDCGRLPDFAARLGNNTHQVSGRRARAPPGLRGAAPGAPARAPRVSAEGTPAVRPPPRPPRPRPRNCGGRSPARAAALSSQGRPVSPFTAFLFASCQNLLSVVVFRLCK